jgi:hypothetical protein
MEYDEVVEDVIKDFNPGILKCAHFNMVCVGMPASGKTSFVKSIYSKYMRKMFDEVHVFAPTKDTKQLYEDMEPNLQFHEEEVDEKGKKIPIYDEFYDKYANDEEDEKDEKDKPKKKKIQNIRRLVIIDDHYEKDINKNTGMMKLFASGRHINTSIIFICQYYYVMITEIMKNCTSIFAFFQNGRKVKSQIVDIIADELSLIYPDEKKKFFEDIGEKIYNEEVMKKKYHGLIISREDGMFRYVPKILKYKK